MPVRVFIEADMTVCHGGYDIVSLRAGQVVEGPLAAYLIDSSCRVTVEEDDRESAPAKTPAPEGTPPATHPPAGAGQDSSGADGGKPPAPEGETEPPDGHGPNADLVKE